MSVRARKEITCAFSAVNVPQVRLILYLRNRSIAMLCEDCEDTKSTEDVVQLRDGKAKLFLS